MKSVQIQSYFWSVFSYIRTEYGEIRRTGKYRPEATPYLDTFYAVIQTKLPPVRNPTPCLKYKRSLVFDVIDFTCDLKLFKAFNRKYFDVADSLITIPCCINYDGLYKPIAFLLIIIIIFAKKSNNQTAFAYSTSVTAQGFSQLFFSFF